MSLLRLATVFYSDQEPELLVCRCKFTTIFSCNDLFELVFLHVVLTITTQAACFVLFVSDIKFYCFLYNES